jgi:hypothetical protein
MDQLHQIIRENAVTNTYIKVNKEIDEEVIKTAQVKFDILMNFAHTLLLTLNNNANQICENVILNDHLREEHRELYHQTLTQRSTVLTMINTALVETQDNIKNRPVVHTLVNSINSLTQQLPIFPEEEVRKQPRMNADREALIEAYADPEVAYYAEHTKSGRQLRHRFIHFG